MDNKKWSKRFSTIFWWLLAILPLIIALIWFLGAHVTFNSGFTTAQEYIDLQSEKTFHFLYFLNTTFEGNDYIFGFNDMSLPFIKDFIIEMCRLLDNDFSLFLVPYLLSWMVSVVFYHLIFDIIVWFPCYLHDFMDRFRK